MTIIVYFLSLYLYYWKKELQGELDCLIRPFVNIMTFCTDRDNLKSAYFVRGVGEYTSHKSSVICNQFIIGCKYEKTHCAPLA